MTNQKHEIPTSCPDADRVDDETHQNARYMNRIDNSPGLLIHNIGSRLAENRASPMCGHQGSALAFLLVMLRIHECAAEAQKRDRAAESWPACKGGRANIKKPRAPGA